MLVAENFRAALWRYNLPELDQHGGSIYGVTADYRLAYFNRAWFDFAAANDGEPAISSGWTLGRCLLDCIPDVLRPFYTEGFDACRTLGAWQHDYECSTPTRYRRFHQRVLALDGEAGFLVFNSLVVERAHDAAERKPYPPAVAAYTNRDGLIIQCCTCRRVKFPDEHDRWDWVPDWVRNFPRHTSHGLCPPCFRNQYPLAS
jgi:hypothetical protein